LAREQQVLHELASGEGVSSKPWKEVGGGVWSRGSVCKVIAQFKRSEVVASLTAFGVAEDVVDRFQIVVSRAEDACV
jgi:hypothetical protein